MKGSASAAILLLNSIMSSDDFKQSEVPSTSQDGVDFLGEYDDDNNVFYNDDSSPMWTDSIIELSSSTTTDSQILPFEERQTENPILDLVKGELKHRIRSRRHASGQDDIVIEFTSPETPENLTGDDAERKREQREKNRVAAQKCRGKKRERADQLEGAVQKLENKKSRISEEIEKLRNEKEHLEDLISIHSSVCPKMRKTENS